ncbi:urease accessory UreF family protein, partial [Acinetobacter baumannii]|uniref:ATP-binding protein n=1 Tax=Acinetobacter baumannii TaxID=470 RepID=UPI00294FFB6D
STILDAMCLALFNRVPRLKDSDGKLKDVDGSELLTNSPLTVLENQVLAAVKTVPLGQMAGQRILWHLHGRVPQAVEKALKLK